jgi:sulfur-oxidizing protein SoxX
MKITFSMLTGAAVLSLVAGCASVDSGGDLDAEFAAMMKSSFRDRGIAKVDRLDQDLAQSACSSPKPPPAEVAKRIETDALATIQWPAGGRYIGDWKAGEKLAQSGRGMTWKDKSTATKGNGGMCYNCHQLSKKEISFGTIGPSLYNYGKMRGVRSVTDPAAVAASAAVIQYTWGKLWNSRAYSACSNMPRFGHMQLLDENQIRDLMALLLDPDSPVNASP